jgi:hypothetical protein
MMRWQIGMGGFPKALPALVLALLVAAAQKTEVRGGNRRPARVAALRAPSRRCGKPRARPACGPPAASTPPRPAPPAAPAGPGPQLLQHGHVLP